MTACPYQTPALAAGLLLLAAPADAQTTVGDAGSATRSTPVTVCPSARNRSPSARPSNPAAPDTKTFMAVRLAVVEWGLLTS